MLITVAHPDDETFGSGSTIAHYAAAGVEVHVGCATRGEAGEIAPESDATPETLGDVREAELRSAADVLGVHRVQLLGFRDSGVIPADQNDDPAVFINANEADVIVKLTRLIRDVRLHVVLTMASDGGTGHPDHVRISELTIRTFKLAAHPGYMEHGGLVHAPSKLYYGQIPRSVMQGFMDAIAAEHPEVLEQMREMGIDKFGVDDDEISTRVDVSDVIETRLKANACHVSQGSPFDMLPPDMLQMALSTDYFTRAIPGWTGGEQGNDLFVGL